MVANISAAQIKRVYMAHEGIASVNTHCLVFGHRVRVIDQPDQILPAKQVCEGVS